MSHCGFDTDWWHSDDWKAVYEAMKPYNVILYLYGHTGTGSTTGPEGETKRWTCVNDGNTTAASSSSRSSATACGLPTGARGPQGHEEA